MSVPLQTPYNVATGNGASTVYPYQFLILAAADLAVYIDGVLKTNGADYSVSGVGSVTGGNVTFVVAPANNSAVRLLRAMRRERLTDYQQLGDFLTAVVNPDFDRAILLAQDLKTSIGLAIRAPDYDVSASMQLPDAPTRASKVIVFDTLGNANVSDPLTLLSLAAYGGTLSLFGGRIYAGASSVANSYGFLTGASISGQASVAAVGGVISPLNFVISGDTVDTTTLNGGFPARSNLRMLSINLGVQPGHTGGRSAIFGEVQVVGAPGVSPSALPGYVGGEFLGFVNANLTGATGAFTNYQGSIYGINPTALLGANATFLAVANASEFDIGVQYGASVGLKFGLNIVKLQQDVSQGVFSDQAIAIIDQPGYLGQNIPATGTIAGKSYVIKTVGTTDFTLIGSLTNTIGQLFNATGAGAGTGVVNGEIPPWNYGLSLGGYSSQWPFDGSSTIIGAQQRVLGIPGTMPAYAMQLNGGYKIATVGTTDYTLVGSPNNTVGTVFIATGPATGTGTVTRGQNVANIGIDFSNVTFKSASLQLPGFSVGPNGLFGAVGGSTISPSLTGSATLTLTGAAGQAGLVVNANSGAVGNGIQIFGTFAGANNYLLQISDINNTQGAGIKFTGNGGTTPAKTIRATSGNFDILNNASGLLARFSDGGGLKLTLGLGLNGNAIAAQPTGYGTPTNAANQGSFDATTITLPNLAKEVAQLVLDLKTYGLIAA